MRRNYQKELDTLIALEKASPFTHRVLLHSCCAPCSSYVVSYLSQYFDVTVFYYNPNIAPDCEYRQRAAEQKRLLQEMELPHRVEFLEGPYEPARFYAACTGLEKAPEGGERCRACFALRLYETARLAADKNFDYFTTTLSVSPLKNAALLNAVGEEASKLYGVRYLPSDFKKRDGYRISVQLSKKYGLYRQDYCGCIFSKRRVLRQEDNKK